MNQELRQNPPTIEQQLDFIRGARHLVSNQHGGSITLDEKNHPILMEIEKTLLASKVFDQLNGTSYIDLVFGVGKRVSELVCALQDAKQIIKTFHDFGNPETEEAWKIYESKSPEMVRINHILKRYEQALQVWQEADKTRTNMKEVSNA